MIITSDAVPKKLMHVGGGQETIILQVMTLRVLNLLQQELCLLCLLDSSHVVFFMASLDMGVGACACGFNVCELHTLCYN